MTSKFAFAYLLIVGLAAWLPASANPYLSTPYALATQVMDPDEPVVPEERVEQIRADLDLIELLLPGASSWLALGPFIPGSMGLYLTGEATERWEAGTYTEMESILDEYDGTVTRFRKWESLDSGWLDIEFAEPLNTRLLKEPFAAVPGVQEVSLNSFLGDGDRVFYVPETGLYIFRHGYGDCPAGCTGQDVYYFQVEDDEVTALNLEAAKALSGISINPVSGLTSVDTHESVTLGNGINVPQSYDSVFGRWYRSESPDFIEYEEVGYGESLEIPFVRLSDAGYYKPVFSLRATGFSFVGPVIQLEVTDTIPTDPDKVVEIEDPWIRQYLIDRHQIPSVPIGKGELTGIRTVDLDFFWIPSSVTSLEGLQDMTNLESIGIRKSAVTDVSPLAGLSQLRTIRLGSDDRQEALELTIGNLAGLPELEVLELNNYRLGDPEKLSQFSNLRWLDLTRCGIGSIDFLIGLGLRDLVLTGNPVSDLLPLLELPNLRSVELMDTPVDFSEDSPDQLILDALREQGVWVEPSASRLPRLWSTETWIPASGGSGFFWMRPGIAHDQVYHDADWLTMLGDGNPYEKVRFEVEPNPDPEPRTVRLVVHNLAHVVHQLGNSGPWRNAIPVGEDGWRCSDWLGFVLPGEDNWIWHPEHGWLSVVGTSEESLWFYDPAMGCWLWTNAALYPFLYRNDDASAWLFYVKGAAPGERWFYDVATGSFVHEG